eukprot:7238333-Pyramimonas_sp.AAC.1
MTWLHATSARGLLESPPYTYRAPPADTKTIDYHRLSKTPSNVVEGFFGRGLRRLPRLGVAAGELESISDLLGLESISDLLGLE